MITELENLEFEYVLSDDNITNKANDPFLFSLISEN